MFLVTTSPPSRNCTTQCTDNTVNSNISKDNCGFESSKENRAPPTILFLHGNAGNIGHRYKIKSLVTKTMLV